MHIVENKSRSGKKIYRSTLLRESYREEGKVKKRTIANLSNCTPREIESIRLALAHKDDLSALGALSESVELHEGLSVGAVWSVYRVAKELGIEEALGKDCVGKLALWQGMARVIGQGSRLSAVRLAQMHAAGDVLDMKRGFDENTLYDNLSWLSENQERIERKLFKLRRGDRKPKLFLYDVTSSYLEGEWNHFGEYGCNRDGKKGKKQIVIGMLCDEFGEPVSTEVCRGNTRDPKTFESQVKKVLERFGCKEVTIVGDRGMIKTMQIERLPEGFHYITAITRPQIESLINKGILQSELFEEKLTRLKLDAWVQRKEESTRGQVFVVMLAYMIIRRLRRAWMNFDLTVEEGLAQLATMCSMEVTIKGQKASCQKIPRPRQQSHELSEALQIKLPEVLPSRNIRVVTRKKLAIRRKSQ